MPFDPVLSHLVVLRVAPAGTASARENLTWRDRPCFRGPIVAGGSAQNRQSTGVLGRCSVFESSVTLPRAERYATRVVDAGTNALALSTTRVAMGSICMACSSVFARRETATKPA